MRHVVQFDKLTGKLKAPFFEKLSLALFGIIFPRWFYEGDAVRIETTLSNTDRERKPEWHIPFRANVISRKPCNDSKDYLGSTRDLAPTVQQISVAVLNVQCNVN
jgi:hypothetical protein